MVSAMSMFVDIEKRMGAFFLKVNFEVGEETLALLGASGCGKSMTLKCIAGIEKPDRGRIVVDGVTLFDSEKGIHLPPQKRCLGMMFQNYALFPNMTVEQNIKAGTKREKNKKERQYVVEEMMERFGLRKYAGHYPHQLSGGQQQRTALARILVSTPRALLLDEPFSALDNHLRFRLEQEVREVIRGFNRTVLLVSHDRDEVFRMAQTIAVMDEGKVEILGSRDAVFENPKTVVSARLTGCKNISAIERRDTHRVFARDWGLELSTAGQVGEAAAIGVRMHDICQRGGENSFLCRVADEIENPFSYTIMLKPDGKEDSAPFGWELEKESWEKIRAKTVEITIPPEAILLLREGDCSG
ncbi:MAG: sulfate/molybdate ABC transporter ATP-binding protein [Roseburia sp.]